MDSAWTSDHETGGEHVMSPFPPPCSPYHKLGRWRLLLLIPFYRQEVEAPKAAGTVHGRAHS